MVAPPGGGNGARPRHWLRSPIIMRAIEFGRKVDDLARRRPMRRALVR